jgi:hypothetical protein
MLITSSLMMDNEPEPAGVSVNNLYIYDANTKNIVYISIYIYTHYILCLIAITQRG